MSVRVSALVWRNGPTKAADQLMMLALADNADDHGFCWPGLATLAAKCRVSESAARRTLHRLQDDGWLTIRAGGGRRPDGRGIPNSYSLDLDRLSNPGVDARVNPGVDAPYPGVDAHPTLAWTPGEPSLEPPSEPSVTPVAAAPGGDAPLAGMPEPTRAPSAGDLVAAWCDGWSDTRGRAPDASVVRRVSGACSQVAKTRTDIESWQTAWHAARDAGRVGRYDLVGHLADFRPPSNQRGNPYAGLVVSDPAVGDAYARMFPTPPDRRAIG